VAGRCFPLAPISEAWRLESTPQPRPGVRQLADVSCRGSSGRAGRGGVGEDVDLDDLPYYTLSPIEEERVSEAAGVNSAGGSFGLSFGLAFAGAIMLVSLSLVFTHMADNSKVLSAPSRTRSRRGSRRTPSDDEHAPRRTPRRPARRREGGHHPHQHEGAAQSPTDRAARAARRRAARPPQRHPDDAPSRP
jgi:hypothetical protein